MCRSESTSQTCCLLAVLHVRITSNASVGIVCAVGSDSPPIACTHVYTAHVTSVRVVREAGCCFGEEEEASERVKAEY